MGNQSKTRRRRRLGAYLNAWRDVVDDADAFAVGVSGQRVRDDVVLHLPCRLVARLHAVDGFTRWTLKAEDKQDVTAELISLRTLGTKRAEHASDQPAVLVAVVVHRHQTLEVVLVSTLCQSPH